MFIWKYDTIMKTFYHIYPHIMCHSIFTFRKYLHRMCLTLCTITVQRNIFQIIQKNKNLSLGKYGIPLFPVEMSGDSDIFIILCQDVYCANVRCRLENTVQYCIKVSKNS
jgi:hypothetical protein